MFTVAYRLQNVDHFAHFDTQDEAITRIQDLLDANYNEKITVTGPNGLVQLIVNG